MRIAFMAALLMLVSSHILINRVPETSSDYSASVEKLVNSVSSILTGIADSGGKAWEKIGTGQADSILQDIGTDTANLEIRNNNLKTELEQSIKDNKMRSIPIGQRVESLTSALQGLSKKLSRFATEVDKAAHPIGEEARVQFNSAAGAKGVILNDIQYDWMNAHYQKALDEITQANAQLDRMRAIVTCLQDSIKSKKSACDPKQFSH